MMKIDGSKIKMMVAGEEIKFSDNVYEMKEHPTPESLKENQRCFGECRI